MIVSFMITETFTAGSGAPLRQKHMVSPATENRKACQAFNCGIP